MAEEYSKKWKEINTKVRCGICEEKDQVFRCIKCESCEAYFHKTCVNPLRADWPEDEKFICDDCADNCGICEQEDDEDEENPAIICDNCQEWFHYNCLEEDDRPPVDEIGNEEIEWYCPECFDEYASDIEWAEEHEVDEQDMKREDCFTRSTCPCKTCSEMNEAVDTWKDFQPQNPIQMSLKQAIDSREGLVNQIMDELHFTHAASDQQQQQEEANDDNSDASQ